MSNIDTSVVICCAGMGTRLGIGTTKALMHINGKPLIIHQLEALDDFEDIRVVVGYQADRVIEAVNSYRKDIMFAFNNEFKTTGPAASLEKGMINPKKYILSIDGDILICPNDLKKILACEGEYLAITDIHSEEPICVLVERNQVKKFKKDGNYEWPGVAKIRSARLKKDIGYIYDIIDELLPIPAILVQSRDIDTPEDYENAIEWVKNGYK